MKKLLILVGVVGAALLVSGSQAKAVCGGCNDFCFNCPDVRCGSVDGCCKCCTKVDKFCNHQNNVSTCQTDLFSCP